MTNARNTALTAEALEESIKAWEAHVAADGYDRKVDGCALCDRFDNGDWNVRCTLDGEKCPVYFQTGMAGCRNTPFYDDGMDRDRAESMLELLVDLRDPA